MSNTIAPPSLDIVEHTANEQDPRRRYAQSLEALGLPEGIIEVANGVEYGPGFQIERAATPKPAEAFPVDTILPTVEERTDYLETGLQNGTIRKLKEGEHPRPGEDVIDTMAIAQIARADYEAKEHKQLIKTAPKENLEDGELIHEKEAEALGFPEAFPAEHQMAIREVLRWYIEDHPESFDRIPKAVMAQVSVLSEAFTFESFGKSFALYNLTDTRLTDTQLRELCNAVRAQAQQSGGGIMDEVPVMTVLPGTGGHNLSGHYWEYYWKGSVAGRVDPNGENVGNVYLNGDYLTGRKTVDPTHAVRIGSLEGLVFHEMTHANSLKHHGEKLGSVTDFGDSVGWKPNPQDPFKPYKYEGPNNPPTPYAGKAPQEDEAETATALHAGGAVAQNVSDDRLAAMEQLWEETHSGVYGPAYVRCREIDLAALHARGSKLGLEPSRPLAAYIDVSYRINQ